MTNEHDNNPTPRLRLVGGETSSPVDHRLDPELEAQLDVVLSPERLPGGVPADLEQKILAKTLPLLGRRRGVIAVFRELPWMGRIAAMLYFAGLLGLGFTGAGIVHDAGEQVTIRRELPVVVSNLSKAVEALPQRTANLNRAVSTTDRAGLWADWQTLEATLESELSQLENTSETMPL